VVGRQLEDLLVHAAGAVELVPLLIQGAQKEEGGRAFWIFTHEREEHALGLLAPASALHAAAREENCRPRSQRTPDQRDDRLHPANGVLVTFFGEEPLGLADRASRLRVCRLGRRR